MQLYLDLSNIQLILRVSSAYLNDLANIKNQIKLKLCLIKLLLKIKD